jgi:hypothetical protein
MFSASSHQIVGRRGRLRFLVTMAGKVVCFSENPIVCTAEALLDKGHELSTAVTFHDASNGLEEVMTLQQAAEWQMPGLGNVVPFRRTAT